MLLPAAFESVRSVLHSPALNVERVTRRTTGRMLRDERVIPKMIERIKGLLQEGDHSIGGIEAARGGGKDVMP